MQNPNQVVAMKDAKIGLSDPAETLMIEQYAIRGKAFVTARRHPNAMAVIENANAKQE